MLWCVVAAAGQPLLAVFVEGVDGPLRDNVLAFLEIRRQAGKPVTDPTLLTRLLRTTRLSKLIPLTRLLEDAADEVGRAARQSVASGPPVSYYQLDVDEARLRWLHERAEEDIRRALKPFGYYHPTVAASLERSGQGWVARYQIDLGPPVRITSVQVSISGVGSSDPAFQEILADLPFQKGDVLIQPNYEESEETAAVAGYRAGLFRCPLRGPSDPARSGRQYGRREAGL